MSKLIDRLKLVFLGIFAISCVAIWGYQVMVAGPPARCEAQGNWWDPQGHVCATPIDVRSFPRIAPPPPHRGPAAAQAQPTPPSAQAPARP